jgi:hypothetical protein
MRASAQGQQTLSADHGAVAVDSKLVELGRRTFYQETFENEIYITDVAGMIAGPLPLSQYVKSIAALKGRGTSDLTVEVAQDAVIGGQRFKKGQVLHTGLDVLPGGVAPLGLRISMHDGRPRVGMTCALCHSTVDHETFSLLEGAPNTDIQMGLLLAFASNSVAFLPNGAIGTLAQHVKAGGPTVQQRDGTRVALADPVAIEESIDRVFLSWPAGAFDSTPDMVANPSQIPSSFTRGAHPYGWTGFAAAGPFKGLSVLSNNVHGINADAISNAEGSEVLFDIDTELFLATLLQRAARREFRFDPQRDQQPSAFLAKQVGADRYPGTAEHVRLPTYPKPSFVSPNGLWMSTPEHRVWEQINALSAFQNTLVPRPSAASPTRAQGQAVFDRAGCQRCHSGEYFTNNRVLPVAEVGTEPGRAPAMHRLQQALVPAQAWPFSAKVPLQTGVEPIAVPIAPELREQLELAWAFGDGSGGYKVPSLLGLAWTAPYLHDGGVAVGPDPEHDLGVPGTLRRQVLPDPAQSLRALIDRKRRAAVVAANAAEPDLTEIHVQGIGHEFWVDSEAGYLEPDQNALIAYLLALPAPHGG